MYVLYLFYQRVTNYFKEIQQMLSIHSISCLFILPLSCYSIVTVYSLFWKGEGYKASKNCIKFVCLFVPSNQKSASYKPSKDKEFLRSKEWPRLIEVKDFESEVSLIKLIKLNQLIDNICLIQSENSNCSAHKKYSSSSQKGLLRANWRRGIRSQS